MAKTGLIFLFVLVFSWVQADLQAQLNELNAENTEQQQCGPRIRRAWRTLLPAEQTLYIDAVVELKNRGLYDNFVLLHYSSRVVDYGHMTSAFLPWHRWYLWHFENALRALGGRFACITVPYWDWERDDSRNRRNSAIFVNGAQLFGTYSPSNNVDGVCVRDGAFRNWRSTTGGCLRRQWDATTTILQEAQVLQVMTVPRYGDSNERNPGFRLSVEGRMHGPPHVFIGGHMGDTTSPNDPLFFIHHCNVDRLWAIWQDCHEFDKVNYNTVQRQNYPWFTASGAIDHVLSSMPYIYENARQEQMFHLPNGQFPSPRDVMQITGNTFSGLDYGYAANDNMVQLLNDRYGRCVWDWFGPNSNAGNNGGGAAGNPMNGNGNANAGKGNGNANAGKGNGNANAGKGNGNANAGKGNGNANAGKGNGAANAGKGNGAANPNRPVRPNRPNLPNRPNNGAANPNRPVRPNRPGLGNAGKGNGNAGAGNRPGLGGNVLNLIRNNPALANLFRMLQPGNKRTVEDIQQQGQPVVRSYGTVAQGLINQIKKHFQVADTRVQMLIESICDSNPITKLAPAEEKIYMAALGECSVIGTEKHVNEKWIRVMKMENHRKIFDPICPTKTCCNVTEMINTALLCPGGGIAAPVCQPSCLWKYDCANKTTIEEDLNLKKIAEDLKKGVISSAISDDDSQFADSDAAVSDNLDSFNDVDIVDQTNFDAAISDVESDFSTDAAFADSFETFNDETAEFVDAAVEDTDYALTDDEIAALAEFDNEEQFFAAVGDYADETGFDYDAATEGQQTDYYPVTTTSNADKTSLPTFIGVFAAIVVVVLIVLVFAAIRFNKKQVDTP